MKHIIILSVISLLFMFAGCVKQTAISDRPDWIESPGSYFIGKCGTHVRGLLAQEMCAYKKGLAYIAMSKGVNVDVSSNMTIKQSASEATGQSFGQLQAVVKMDEKNIQVKAEIIDKWHDKTADIIYVLIKENK